VSDATKAVAVISTVMTGLLRIAPPVTVILTQILTPPNGGVVSSYRLNLWSSLFLHAAPRTPPSPSNPAALLSNNYEFWTGHPRRVQE